MTDAGGGSPVAPDRRDDADPRRDRLAGRPQPLAGDPQRGDRGPRPRPRLRGAARAARRRRGRRSRASAALGFVGANVTMPHKTEAAAIVDERSRRRGPARRRQHDRRDGGRPRRAQHRRAGVRPDAPPRREVRPGRARTPCFSAPAAPRGPCALALARGGRRARHRRASATPPVRRRSIAALAGLDTAVEVVGFDQAPAMSGRPARERDPAWARTARTLPTPPLTASTLVIDLLYHPAVTPLIVRARAAGARRPAASGCCCIRPRSRSSCGRGRCRRSRSCRPRRWPPWPSGPSPSGHGPAATGSEVGPDAQGTASRRRCLHRDAWTNTPRSRSASP